MMCPGVSVIRDGRPMKWRERVRRKRLARWAIDQSSRLGRHVSITASAGKELWESRQQQQQKAIGEMVCPAAAGGWGGGKLHGKSLLKNKLLASRDPSLLNLSPDAIQTVPGRAKKVDLREPRESGWVRRRRGRRSEIAAM